MITLGYDIGTRFVKSCIIDNNKIIGFSIMESGMDIVTTIADCYNESIKLAGIKKRNIKKIAASGYGAEMVSKSNYTLTQEACLTKAAFQLDPNIRTVVDVGGLFIHTAAISDKGILVNYCENEKCAAGSGKFIELISESIGVSYELISEYTLKSTKPTSATNSCAVFAESEVVSLVNTGKDKIDIIAGVINSIALKAATLVNRVEANDIIAVTGGVAKIEAFRILLEKALGRRVVCLKIEPQLVVAYGAALFAQRKSGKSKNKR